MRTFYQVKQGNQVLGNGGTTKELQDLLENASPGAYAVDIVDSDAPEDAANARHWGMAIKHGDGTVHLESDQPGE